MQNKHKIKRILIANRGEISCRIIRTCKKLNIETVCVFSHMDGGSPFTLQADFSCLLEGETISETYLNIDKILSIARKYDVCAIHPGYGFLSENAEFSERCHKEGFIFIGPTSDVIKSMGDKAEAKNLFSQSKVPMLPGYHGKDQSYETLLNNAQQIGMPLLIKASAGGGGKGMRIVEDLDSFKSSLLACQREAKTSFGSDRVIIEKFLRNPRHIEIQIFADNHKNAVHLYERDCSIQRRYQKIIEEAPAPNIPNSELKQLYDIAVNAVIAIGYTGAGTLEFMYEDGNFYFMEMNTRLQVEHPVTEMITGIDLVEWQIRIADGEKIPLSQKQIKIHGHAIEARIYAEDPNNDFLPSTGTIQALSIPVDSENIRLEHSLCLKQNIGVHFDPMLAKLISHGDTRDQAITNLFNSLKKFNIAGVTSNIGLLRNILANNKLLTPYCTTSYIKNNLDIIINNSSKHTEAYALAIYLINNAKKNQTANWDTQNNWRPNYCQDFKITLKINNKNTELKYSAYNNIIKVKNEYEIIALDNNFYVIINSNQKYTCWGYFDRDNGDITISVGYDLIIINYPAYNMNYNYINASDSGENNNVASPMPGVITQLLVKENTQVAAEQSLVTLEAMKMEHTIKAPCAGTVVKFLYNIGDNVSNNAKLLDFIPMEGSN